MDETIPTAEIPQIVSSLPMFKIAIPYDVHGFALDRNSLMFMAGGGFGHWGIIVCKDVNDRTIPRAYGKRVLLWADGVYFYRGE